MGEIMPSNGKKGKNYATKSSVQSTKTLVLDLLRERIGVGNAERIPYDDIAKEIGRSRGAVSYAMNALYKMNYVSFEDGKIRLCQ